METNPLKQLNALGQSIWLGYIRRDLIVSGGLRRLIEEDGLRGMTSNPAIFEKAIDDSHDYDEDTRAMALVGKSAQAIYEALSQRDVQKPADAFRPLYDKTDGQDGYVSLEVNPHLARDTNGTIQEARRLWDALNRPNVFIKVPATDEGLPVIRQLISEGINVNVTLIFGDGRADPDDDYPDFVVPLARAVARGEVDRGVAICGSGVGACVVANKAPGVRACLIHETFSAHQGVEDDDLNVICLGGLVVGQALAWELVRSFLTARFSGADRHRRRLAKVADLEKQG